jgi:acyl carrier protein
MKTQQESIIELIRKIVSEQILVQQRADEIGDPSVAGLDSIGRLTLLVALENETGIELMGPDIGSEVFQSLATLTEFVMRKTAASGS